MQSDQLFEKESTENYNGFIFLSFFEVAHKFVINI